MADETPPVTSPFAGLDRALLRETKKPHAQGKGATSRQTGKATSSAPRRMRQRPAPPTTSTGSASALGSRSDSTEASSKDITEASNVSGRQDGNHQDVVIESLRKAVKPLGDRVSYVRLTDAEKDRLQEVVTTLSQQGLKTTENEVSRIAIAYLLTDHDRNGRNSIVARVVEALLS